MPTFKQHIQFISSKPYSKWYVIRYNNHKVGSVYLTKRNEIGISISDEKRYSYFRKDILKLLISLNPREEYFVNINPMNKKLINLYKKNGFKLIQYTYALEKNHDRDYINKKF